MGSVYINRGEAKLKLNQEELHVIHLKAEEDFNQSSIGIERILECWRNYLLVEKNSLAQYFNGQLFIIINCSGKNLRILYSRFKSSGASIDEAELFALDIKEF